MYVAYRRVRIVKKLLILHPKLQSSDAKYVGLFQKTFHETLFIKFPDTDLTNSAENQVLIVYYVQDIQDIRSRGDLSYLLTRNEDLNKYFISDILKSQYSSGIPPQQILEIRRDEIVKAEKEFVESLGMMYEDLNLF